MRGFVKSLLISSALVSVVVSPSLEAGKEDDVRAEVLSQRAQKQKREPNGQSVATTKSDIIDGDASPVSGAKRRRDESAGSASSESTETAVLPEAASTRTVLLPSCTITSTTPEAEPDLEAINRAKVEAVGAFLRKHGIQNELPVTLSRNAFKTQIVDSGRFDEFKGYFERLLEGSVSLGVHAATFSALNFHWLINVMDSRYPPNVLEKRTGLPLCLRVKNVVRFYTKSQYKEYMSSFFTTYHHLGYYVSPEERAALDVPANDSAILTDTHASEDKWFPNSWNKATFAYLLAGRILEELKKGLPRA